MTASRSKLRQRPEGFRGRAPMQPGPARVSKLALLAWAALLFNVLTPSGGSVLPIPSAMAQAMAQGSLVVALLFAVLANPRLVIRPSMFLVLMLVTAILALIVSLHAEFLVGSSYRSVRFVGFVICLWLLTPWWGRADLVLLRIHRTCLWVVLATVLIGVVIAPGKAFAFDGRLGGVLWPIPATQVAHYSAVMLGTSAILWMCRVITGRHAAWAVTVTGAVLVGTHTRTALVGVVVGLTVACASLFLGHARVRRTSASVVLAGIVAATLFGSQVTGWLSRGQSADEAAQLTGRTEVWSSVSEVDRPLLTSMFGQGLSNKSFEGLPVDNGWVSMYLDLGWFGVALQASCLLLLLLMAVTRVRGPRRAVAIFLIVYCIVASMTETGLGDASAYCLDLVVAASLLVPAPRLRERRSAVLGANR